MKRFFNFALVLLTAAGLASCQRFEDEAILPDAYSVIVNTAETRTANDGYNTVWSSGDEMTMFWKSSKGSLHSGKFSYTSGSTFTTTESVGTSDYRWYGVYPYLTSNKSYTEVSASIPASQTQDGNDSKAHLAGSGFPLWGRTDGDVPNGDTPVFTAHQVATVLKYVVTNTGETPVTVTKIQFSAPTAIAGACKADLTSENVVWQPRSSNTSQSVTLNVTNGSTIKNGESASFFVGAIPFYETGEYTVNVYATDGENNYVYTNKVNGRFVAESGKINTIPLNFVPGDPVAGVTGYELVTSEPSDWSGRYILVSADKKLVFTGDNGTNNKYTLSSTDLSDGIITKDCSAYEFTITKSGSNYYLKNTAKNQYLYCDYSGNRDTGMSYSSSQRALNLKVQNDGTFGFWMRESNTDQYIYYKSSSGSSGSGCFKFGGSHDNHCVYLYKWTEGGTPVDPPTPTTEYYELVTSEPASWDGTYLIVNAASGSAYAFDYTTASGSSASGMAVTISDGKIYSNATIDACAVTVSKYGDSHGSEPEHAAYDIKVNSGKYLFRYGSPTKIIQDSSEQGSGNSKRQNQHTLVYDNGVRMMFSGNKSGTTNNKYYFHYSSSQFTYESGKETDRVYFFRLVDGDQPEKQTQTLSFANSAVEWTLGDTYKVGSSYDAQSVSGAKTTVTLTSSNEDVATISDGKIKIVGAGTTNIIATAAENDTYKSGSASYTLTINPAQGQPTTKVYTKVTSAPTDWSGTYIIVDESAVKAFDEKASTYASDVTISDGKIAWSETVAKYEVTISKSSVSGMYDLKTVSGNYMYSYNYGKETWESRNEQSGNTYYNSLSISGGNVTMYSTRNGTGSPSVNYFGYESSASNNPNSKNFGYKDGATTRTVQLYKLNGESTPSTPDTPSEPTPDGTTFNLENSYLKSYLDAASDTYTNNTSKSIVSTYSGTSSTRDLPNPVKLTWSGNATGIDIYEGTSTSGKAFKSQSFTSSTSVEVYNLIPGKTYSYKTSNGQTGTFNTTGRRRMIMVSSNASQNHARNCRDLGGIKTRKGETLNYALMYRGTNMDSVDKSEAEKNILLNELGIKLDQDLRGSSKSPIGVAISGEGYDANTIQNQDGDNMKKTVSDVMNAVIKGDPVYIHCLIGSDRTGHMCMLYLALLGCDLKECDIDYEITSFASKMTGGTRTIGSGNEAKFRSKFIDKSIDDQTFDANHVPEAVERYVTNVLGIDIATVKAFRSAMGVSETLN